LRAHEVYAHEVRGLGLPMEVLHLLMLPDGWNSGSVKRDYRW